MQDSMNATADYYELLEIDTTATQAEIKKAYRALAQKYHPDINPDDTAEEHIKKLNSAYAVLSNPQQRQIYDLYGEVPLRARAGQHTSQRPFGGCRGRGMGRGSRGGMRMWQEILRKR